MRRHCTAKTRSGRPCKGQPISGGNVCRMHGGAAPQVKLAAERRLAALVDPAIGVADRAMRDYRKDPPTALRAAFGVLDRTGYGPTETRIHAGTGEDGAISVNVSAREMLARRIMGLAPEPRPIPTDADRTGS